MSLLDIFAPGIGAAAQAIATVVDRLVPDKNLGPRVAAEVQKAMAEAAIKGDLEQLEINKAEAASPSMFVAGARPGFMWLCVFTLAWSWLFAPMLTWVVAAFHLSATIPALPTLAADQAQTALYGLLGLGAFRTADKIWAQPANLTKAVGGILK